MSMENAILEHAGALKELAAAIRSMGVPGALATLAMASTGEIIAAVDGDLVQDKAAELAGATEQRAAAAREAQKKDADEAKKERPPEGAETQAARDAAATVAAVNKEIEAGADVVKAVSGEIEGKDTVAADLDYAKDVRPVLLAAIKKAGKDTVAAMLKTFGVDKADQLKAEQLPAALAKAQALAA